jgi:hypothetical protein
MILHDRRCQFHPVQKGFRSQVLGGVIEFVFKVHIHDGVVHEILADTRKVFDDLDAMLLEMGSRTNAREREDLVGRLLRGLEKQTRQERRTWGE